jgi:hypothetical protein
MMVLTREGAPEKGRDRRMGGQHEIQLDARPRAREGCEEPS